MNVILQDDITDGHGDCYPTFLRKAISYDVFIHRRLPLTTNMAVGIHPGSIDCKHKAVVLVKSANRVFIGRQPVAIGPSEARCGDIVTGCYYIDINVK